MEIDSWTTPKNYDDSLQLIKKLALSHAYEGGTAGERIAAFISSDSFSALCDFDLDYTDISVREARNCRQALSYFSKLEPLDLGRDRKATALAKFWEAESACKLTNEAFAALESGAFSIAPDVSAVIHTAMRKISRVLGDVPSFSELVYRFGPGATTLTKKRSASIVEKLSAGISCSEDLLPYVSRILEEMPHLAELHSCGDSADGTASLVDVLITPDVVEFVPKNAKTMRVITKGGSLSMMVQLALGDHISQNLAAFGVDLTNQATNKRLACQSSIDGLLATVDLSSASDTIAWRLVSHLLPYEWYLALDACRSSTAILDGKLIRLEKFASMGNGFTFALESLIFWALSSSCTSDDYASVYGDDIIVETACIPLLQRVFTTCGFTINMEKSYWAGPFRESCGGDYLLGIDIRPYYQKKLISGEELFKIHNFYVRNLDSARAKLVLDEISMNQRIYGPDGYGDGHLLGDWTPCRSNAHRRAGYGGSTFKTFKHVSRSDARHGRRGDPVLPLYNIYQSRCQPVFSNELVIPDGNFGYASYLRIFKDHKHRIQYAPLEMPERTSQVNGDIVKCPAYPGKDGHKIVSIYTFDTP